MHAAFVPVQPTAPHARVTLLVAGIAFIVLRCAVRPRVFQRQQKHDVRLLHVVRRSAEAVCILRSRWPASCQLTQVAHAALNTH